MSAMQGGHQLEPGVMKNLSNSWYLMVALSLSYFERMLMLRPAKAFIDFASRTTQHRFRMATFPLCTEIKGFGIKFRKVIPETILDIRFNNGSLEIPPLLVQETTETIFQNLIRLEQCYPNCPPIITAYAKLMDNLIDTTEDVEILCDNDVLDNRLNPEDAT
ncbi:hypothetical protein Dsin_031065 [Dipteronia sinensis]|uniref:Uncharacterized protein n=1 Tax=Dipteronia sinensis TaxID=43782 RepID=A0AAD9ZM72_9ROSI|nr:hypothetical protein Dsin_031065 [Dipteronia sinensis]